MQAVLYRTFVDKAHHQSGPIINIVMACEGIADVRRAMRAYDGLARELGRDYDLTYEVLKFETLQTPGLSEAAGWLAREADMLIIATHTDTLQPSVKVWLESCLPHSSARPRALVALIASAAEELARSVPVFTYLRDAAARGKMEFFSHIEELAQKPADAEFSTQRLRGRAETMSSVLEEILAHRSRPEPQWGINE
ncbi:MAG TPA: hypothetical protein VN887_20560 [Candidatus Angelobacter sp.]|nr:hypothetical protein [Candidatus Angelobacter sp.]